jgi:hypothetical protein
VATVDRSACENEWADDADQAEQERGDRLIGNYAEGGVYIPANMDHMNMGSRTIPA